MQRHSAIGERILRGSRRSRRHAPYRLRAVHERPDGTGYPDGLELRRDPSLRPRIIAVVDAFDAMTHRPPLPQRDVDRACAR